VPIAEDVASKSNENRLFRLPHCHLTPHLQGTHTNIRMNLILPETIVIAGTFSPLTVWDYLYLHFRGGLRKRMHFETECILAVQGHSRSLILVPNRKRICNFCRILPLFKDIAGLLLKRAISPLFHTKRILGCSSWTKMPMLRLRVAKTLSLLCLLIV